MGNSCSHVNNNGSRHHHHPIKPRILVPQNQQIRSQSQIRIVEHKEVKSGNRSGSLTIQNRIQKADNEQAQRVSLVTTIVTANIPKANIEEKAIIAATESIQKAGTEEHEVAPATTAADANINRENTDEQRVTAVNINEGNTAEPEVAPATAAAAANIQRAETVVEEVIASMIDLVIENQVDKDNILRSNENKNASSDCEEAKSSNLLILPRVEDRDECPICLDVYDEENPKITIKCRHPFHLGCLYDWMERSATCPVCSKVMEFDDD